MVFKPMKTTYIVVVYNFLNDSVRIDEAIAYFIDGHIFIVPVSISTVIDHWGVLLVVL